MAAFEPNTVLDLSVTKPSPDEDFDEKHPEDNPQDPDDPPEIEYPSSSTSSPSEPPPTTSSSIQYKLPRPFKAYPNPKDSLSVVSSLAIFLAGTYSSEEYVEFRKKMLAEVETNFSNKNMRRQTFRPNSTYEDPTYLEKRRRNNEAAKRSRDARRAKEDEIAIRCAFLEQKNWKLSCEVVSLKEQIEALKTNNNVIKK